MWARASRSCRGGCLYLVCDDFAWQRLISVESFHEVQIREGSVEAIDKRLSVRSNKNRTDGRHAGRISGDELFPESSLPRRQIHAVDFGGNFSGLVHKKGMTVLTPACRQIARLQ